MQILEGMVQDVGYPDEKCIYAKIDDNTLYYFINDYKLPNGNMIATTNLKEAIGHASYTSLGLINEEGKVLIPFENKTIKVIKDQLLLVEKNIPTSESVVSALKNKSDPFAAQGYAENATTIKKQMKEAMGLNGDFIFDNQFSECAIFTMDGINIADNYFSFISENNSNYYLATNVLGATIMKFNPNQLEQPQEEIQENAQQEIPNQLEQPQEEIQENIQQEISNQSEQHQGEIQKNAQQEIPSQQLENNQISTEKTNSEETIDSTIPNIDIPIQNMIDQNQPSTVESSDETSNELNSLSEDTISDQIEDEQDSEELNDSVVKLDIELENPNQESTENKEEQNSLNDELEEETNSENSEESNSIDSEENEEQDSDSMESDSAEIEDEEQTTLESDEQEEVNDNGSEKTELVDNDSNDNDEDEFEDDDSNQEIEQQNDPEDETSNQTYNLTDEDIATPTIKDATNTIKKLLEENRKQRQLIDKQIGEIEALKTNSDILREENFSKEQEIQSLRQEMNDYRTQSINLTRENTKIKGTLTRQSDIMHNLEQQNIILRNQVSGMHALSNAVAEANVLVQPVDIDNNTNTEAYSNSSLDIDHYLNGNYKNNNQEITYSNLGYLDENNQQSPQDSNDGGQSFQKKMVA